MILKRKFRYMLIESSMPMDWKALSAEISGKLSGLFRGEVLHKCRSASGS